MLIAIVLNALVIFFWYFPSLHDNVWMRFADHFFIGLFTIEAVVKISHFGWKRYWKVLWNRLDLVIVY